MSTIIKDKIYILKTEYLKLKKIESRFQDFLAYLDNLNDIRQSREEIKKKSGFSRKIV